MTLTDSTVKDNQSIGGDGNAGDGGGIVNSNSATLNVTNSTFMGNQAKGGHLRLRGRYQQYFRDTDRHQEHFLG